MRFAYVIEILVDSLPEFVAELVDVFDLNVPRFSRELQTAATGPPAAPA